MSTPMRRAMPLITDAAFQVTKEARHQAAREQFARPTVEQIGRQLVRAAVHGDAFTVASKLVRADAPPVTREPPPDGYPVADEPAESTGQPAQAHCAVPEGHPDRVHADRRRAQVKPYMVEMTCGHQEPRFMREQTAGIPWSPDAVVSGSASRPCATCMKQQGMGGADEMAAQIDAQMPEWEARRRELGAGRTAQTPDEEGQLRQLGWSDGAIEAMSERQIELILQRGTKKPRPVGQGDGELPMAARRRRAGATCQSCGAEVPGGSYVSGDTCPECGAFALEPERNDDLVEAPGGDALTAGRQAQAFECSSCGCPKGRHDDMGCRECECSASYGITDDAEWEAREKSLDQMPGVDPAQERDKPFGPQHGSRQAARPGELQVGDLVKYTAKFMQSTGMYTGGPIDGKVVAPGMNERFVQVQWNDRDDPVQVNVANIMLKSKPDYTGSRRAYSDKGKCQSCGRKGRWCPECDAYACDECCVHWDYESDPRDARRAQQNPIEPETPAEPTPGQPGQPTGQPDGAPAPAPGPKNPARTKEVWDQDGKFSREVEADGVDELVRIHRELNDMGLTRSPDAQPAEQEAQAPQQAPQQQPAPAQPPQQQPMQARRAGVLEDMDDWDVVVSFAPPYGSERSSVMPHIKNEIDRLFPPGPGDWRDWDDQKVKEVADKIRATMSQRQGGARRAQWDEGDDGDGEECPLCSAGQPQWSPGTGTCMACGYDAEEMAGVDETVGGDPLFEEYANELGGPGAPVTAQEQGDEFEWKPKRKTPSGAPPADAPVETGVGTPGPMGASAGREATSVSDAIDSCAGECSCACHTYDGPGSGLENALEACEWPCDCPCHPAVGEYDRAGSRTAQQIEVQVHPDLDARTDLDDDSITGTVMQSRCNSCGEVRTVLDGQTPRPQRPGPAWTSAPLVHGAMGYAEASPMARPGVDIRQAQSGYTDCACRDCFDTAVNGDGQPALCGDCQQAGCSAEGDQECQRSDAYGVGDEFEQEGQGRGIDDLGNEVELQGQAWAETTTAPMTASMEQVAQLDEGIGDELEAREEYKPYLNPGPYDSTKPSQVKCQSCGHRFEVTKDQEFRCPECNSTDVHVAGRRTLAEAPLGGPAPIEDKPTGEDTFDDTTKRAADSMKVECQECGKTFKTSSPEPKCPKCGSYDIDLAKDASVFERLAAWYDDISDDKFKKRMKEKADGAEPSDDIEKDAARRHLEACADLNRQAAAAIRERRDTDELIDKFKTSLNFHYQEAKRHLANLAQYQGNCTRRAETARQAQPLGMPPAAAGITFEKSNERSEGDRVVWDVGWDPEQFAMLSGLDIEQQIRSWVLRDVSNEKDTGQRATRNWGFVADIVLEDIDLDAGIATVSMQSSEQAAPQVAPAEVTE